jgi:hypothetical protein
VKQLGALLIAVLFVSGGQAKKVSTDKEDDGLRGRVQKIVTERFDSKYSYTYEFDAQGNWIRRVSSKWVTKDGKSLFEPSSVNYRKISYF